MLATVTVTVPGRTMSNITATMFRSSFKDLNFKSTSENNLPSLNDEIPLNDSERNQEKLETMKIRKNALEETLEKKLSELRSLCLREGVSMIEHLI